MSQNNTLCLCIVGTDTDVGKTVLTAALARAAVAAGLRTLVIKPVQTGSTLDARGGLQSADLTLCREAASGADAQALLQFAAACSPHLAARLEARSDDRLLSAHTLADEIRKAVQKWSAAETLDTNASGPCRKLVLLEGAGGLLTPLGASETLGDLLTLHGWPVLLVAANRLGAVNHALLSLEALRSRHLPCPGFVMTEVQEAQGELERSIRRDNPLITASLGKRPCLAELPYLPGLSAPRFPEREAAWEQAAVEVAPVLKALGVWQKEEAEEATEEALLRFDREHLWHPYTSALRPLRSWEATDSNGSRIRLKDGRELIDGMASWWCAIHGYRHPALMRALQTQAQTLPHIMFGGLTHAPAVRLGQRLLDMAPAALKHVFFADSGSTAVEVALKMAMQYWQAKGETRRTCMLTVRGGYHGDTLGAMSVGDPEDGMHALFSGLLPRQVFAPRPECRFDAPYSPASERAFAEVLAAHADSVAAVILEPIVQGAGGMWFYHPDFLRGVHALCKQHGCLLILDEIATGFGRTGKLFACEYAGVTPDILCLGKGLSGGVLTLAATLATREVAEGVGGALMHGSTFMANPLACAVAEASLGLIAEGAWQAEVARVERGMRQALAPCVGQPGVADVRVLGAIGVVEMEEEVAVERLQTFFVKEGVWIRPFGKVIYLMPPYVATDDDIATLCAAICRAINQEAWRLCCPPSPPQKSEALRGPVELCFSPQKARGGLFSD
ncbi:MAG: adenosylmethionine--8-amino-7-oxononanoate transaminase [Burkholderiales bacterium]|jgi:adenosylmethionine-8-amino-7-oxononanoate aminotransferase|nr:adenosylmethionine--8-amino-7-oxononanoate transaminase [Burkholderiales bacterium]